MRRYGLLTWLPLVIPVLTGCYPQTDAGPQGATLRPVDVVELRHEEVVETLSLIGVTEPWREAVLYFEVSGIVAETFVEGGDLVEPGASIARLVLDDYEIASSRAGAELDNAQAKLNLLRAGTRKEDLEAAEADYAGAAARAAYWISEFRRVESLFRKRTISASEMERVRREHEAANQQQRSAKARWQRAVAGPRTEEIEAAVAEVKARTQAAALARRQLEKATLRAPFRGRVEKRLLDVGAYVNVFPTGGVPVVQLVDLEQVDAVIAVSEADLPRLQDSPSIEIASAVNKQVHAQGQIISVGRVADRASGTYELRVRIANPDGQFTGGMVVTALVTGSSDRRAIRIPLTAVGRAYGRPPYVWLVETAGDPGVDQKESAGGVVQREVKLGPITGEKVEIAEGLSDGDLLIVGGQDRVVVGDQVKYQRAAATPVVQ